MARKNDKRVRLVEAADKLFHAKGFHMTTLANIAEEANVPLGNVYYYFKSKDSIALAVIERRAKMFQEASQTWEHNLDGVNRIKAFIEFSMDDAESRAEFGDSMGSLCQELGKQGGSLSEAAAGLMNRMIGWLDKQFQGLNKGEKSSKLAANLVATLQGISLLTVTFKDPSYLARQSELLDNWLETV